MKDYNKYFYIYPPRPELKIPSISLCEFDNGEYLAQPKLNGSSMQIYMNENELILMNRHKQKINCSMDLKELKSLYRGSNWMILCGEYMNKSQKDENNLLFNNKFVIFDILVYDGVHLLTSTFEERYKLLCDLYPNNVVKKQLHQITLNCYRVNSEERKFKNVYDDLVNFQIYEGLVLKLKTGKLENGVSELNNTRTQLKCRKSTKNYSF